MDQYNEFYSYGMLIREMDHPYMLSPPALPVEGTTFVDPQSMSGGASRDIQVGGQNRVDLALCCFVVFGGSKITKMLGKTARKMSLSHPFLCASNASKNQDLRAMSPYANRQSTGKMPNRPHFAHIQGFPLWGCKS